MEIYKRGLSYVLMQLEWSSGAGASGTPYRL